MKNPDNIPDKTPDFRDALDAPARAQIRLKNPRRSLRLSTLSKVRLCIEILATNKTQGILAREHGCTQQAVSYYVQTLIPAKRRVQPVILFKQGELELVFE